MKKEQLSEGAWISNFTDQADGVASYTLNVPAETDYVLWVRANVIAALLSYQIDDGKPTEIDTSKAIDVVNIASDGTVNTPKSQAVTGFLSKAGTVKLGDLTINSRMEYGTLHVISLDDRPLATSHKILIQAFSEEKMYGFSAEKGVIIDVGRVPITVRDIQGTVTFTNAAGMNATVLDANSYATGNSSPVANGTLSLQRNAMYTIVTRVAVQ